MCIPFISMISAYVIHEQNFIHSFLATNFTLAYLLFFLYFQLKIPTQRLLKILITLGLIWCLIQITQQITYPHYWFATRYDTFDKGIEIRNGIYRYNTYGIPFGLILLFYSFQNFFKFGEKKYTIGIILGLVGIYFTATRQVIAASIFSLFVGLIIMNKLKISHFIFIMSIIIAVYINKEVLFGDFVTMTEDIDSDYIRFITYKYFGLEYNQNNILPILLGNGLEFQSNIFHTPYGDEIMKLQKEGIHRSDIGIVGMYSYYGIFYIITIISLFAYIIRNRKYVEPYQQMYVLYMITTSIMLYHFGYTAANIVTTCSIFYLIDRSISKNKRRKRINNKLTSA